MKLESWEECNTVNSVTTHYITNQVFIRNILVYPLTLVICINKGGMLFKFKYTYIPKKTVITLLLLLFYFCNLLKVQCQIPLVCVEIPFRLFVN